MDDRERRYFEAIIKNLDDIARSLRFLSDREKAPIVIKNQSYKEKYFERSEPEK